LRSRRHRFGAGLIVTALAAVSIGLSTDLNSPPRYDGAGYSVLAWSICTGQGYREIDQPDNPPHTHFPPGYPLALAALWTVTGRSVVAAHLFSIVCTVTAVGLAWLWFRRSERPILANLLAVALAINWTWAVNGGAIQSEPLYLLLNMLVLVCARRPGGFGLGLLLGACVVTRHVGICLVVAVAIDRFVSRRWREGVLLGLTSAIVVLPWLIWLTTVQRNTQADLLMRGGWISIMFNHALFYARRVLDSLMGPYIEVATVFGRSRMVALVATLVAILVSLVILFGLIRVSFDPKKRLAGLIPLVTLPLLLVWPFTEAGRFLVPLVPCLLVGMVEGLSWVLGLVVMRPPHPNPPSRGGRGPENREQATTPFPLWGREPVTRPHATTSPPPLLQGRAVCGVRLNSKCLSAWLILIAALPYSSYALVSGRAGAQRQTHADFDAACAWIKANVPVTGLILTRHPGEVFWQTDRKAVAPSSDDPNILMKQIQEEHVGYLLVDLERFANATPTPLTRLTQGGPDRFRRVHEGSVEVFEVKPDSGP